MPSSRSSSLSRSNMRLNASKESGYPGTASRIWDAVRYLRADSRQTTRLSNRSVFRRDTSCPFLPPWWLPSLSLAPTLPCRGAQVALLGADSRPPAARPADRGLAPPREPPLPPPSAPAAPLERPRPCHS